MYNQIKMNLKKKGRGVTHSALYYNSEQFIKRYIALTYTLINVRSFGERPLDGVEWFYAFFKTLYLFHWVIFGTMQYL